MKLRGLTNSENWHPITLWHMVRDPKCWGYEINWNDWKFDYCYFWYDGPIWQTRVGPIWVTISYLNYPMEAMSDEEG